LSYDEDRAAKWMFSQGLDENSLKVFPLNDCESLAYQVWHFWSRNVILKPAWLEAPCDDTIKVSSPLAFDLG
jgi:hypothetical protein